MKSIKKKTAFILVLAVLTVCLAAPAFAASRQLAANSTWESTVNASVATVMATGQCYVSINLGSEFQDSWVGTAWVAHSYKASRLIFALTTDYGATCTYE